MVLSTETFNQSVRTEYSEALNARYTFQPLWVSGSNHSNVYLDGFTNQWTQIKTMQPKAWFTQAADANANAIARKNPWKLQQCKGKQKKPPLFSHTYLCLCLHVNRGNAKAIASARYQYQSQATSVEIETKMAQSLHAILTPITLITRTYVCEVRMKASFALALAIAFAFAWHE